MKIAVVILNGEILSVQSSENIVQVNIIANSSVYIDTIENITAILNLLGIEDLSKIEEFEKSNVNIIENEVN